MKKCRRCGTRYPVDTMMCRCGFSFVDKPARVDVARNLRGGLGCFVWMHVVNALYGFFLAFLCWTWMASTQESDSDSIQGSRLFAGLFGLTGAANLLTALGLVRRKKFSYNLSMFINGLGLLHFPFGTVIAIVIMTGLSKERHLLDR